MINVPMYPGTVQGVGWRQGLVGQGHGSPAGDLVTWRPGDLGCGCWEKALTLAR